MMGCVRAAYYRRLNKRYPTLMGIGEPSDAWQQLSLTCEVRHSSDMEDTMVLYQKTQPPTVVLASALDLEILHQSHHWVCDGTFQYCPFGFAQLGPSSVATLTSKLEQLDALRPSSVFRLRVACSISSSASPERLENWDFTLYRGEENPALKQWVRKVVGLALLPPELVHWNDCLKHQSPVTNVPSLDAGIGQLKGYFENQWLSSIGQILMWNYYADTDNLRTTNHAEGWHNSFRAKLRCQPGMALGKFMADYQRVIHHSNQVRIRQLQQGHPATRTRANYEANNVAIAELKRGLEEYWRTFVHIPVEPPFQNANEQFAHRINEYLSSVARRLGVNALNRYKWGPVF
ncbi:uncharacterized protein LOC135393784 [Ornithodoros turicata]|uniref:uncharacterized protein LOC135393784 n=1 Tax=Ornithodoros turicata TaxID=34597 RepID=UPI003139ADB5